MAKLDLSKYGITGTTDVVYNPPTSSCSRKRPSPAWKATKRARSASWARQRQLTGIYTGRSPKDKFIVMDENSKNTVWWTSDEYKER